MFNDLAYGKYILSAMALAISVVLVVWLSKVIYKYMSIALGLVIGGALGNTIDRLINGAVADFLDFYIAGYHWPAFNVADSCITIGALILIFDEFIWKRRGGKIEMIRLVIFTILILTSCEYKTFEAA